MKDTRFDIYVGNVFRNIRETKRYSLSDVASELGMTKQRLCNYEQGIRSLSIPEFKRICNFYKINCDALIDLACENTREEINE